MKKFSLPKDGGLIEAINQLEGEAWLKECHIRLYRGAWMEWELGKVDMAVPLSPDEVIKKRHANSGREQRREQETPHVCTMSSAWRNISKVPTTALTVGVGTVMDAKEVLVLAFGHKKTNALKVNTYRYFKDIEKNNL